MRKHARVNILFLIRQINANDKSDYLVLALKITNVVFLRNQISIICHWFKLITFLKLNKKRHNLRFYLYQTHFLSVFFCFPEAFELVMVFFFRSIDFCFDFPKIIRFDISSQTAKYWFWRWEVFKTRALFNEKVQKKRKLVENCSHQVLF